jgi:hypothetical protein
MCIIGPMYAVSPVTKAAVEKAKPLVLESWVLTRARLLWVGGGNNQSP